MGFATNHCGYPGGCAHHCVKYDVNRTKQGHSAPTLTTRRVKDQNRQLQECKMCINSALFRLSMIVAICLLILITPQIAQQTPFKPPASRTQVVLLGTGTPPADPDRSGPASAIVVNGTP